MKRWSVPGLLLAVALAAPFLSRQIPWMGEGYVITFLFNMFLFIGIAYSWNIISGYAGYLSFGHLSFFGIGAYTVALLTTKAGMHWFPAAAVGGLLAVVLAVPVGWLMLRLRGPYFALGMMGLREVLMTVAFSWERVTSGGSGIFLPPTDSLTPLYYIALVIVVGLVVFTSWLDGSSLGLRLMAIKENEEAAQAMGVDTTRYKLVAFTLSAFVPGIAGGLYAWRLTFIDPATAFPGAQELQAILMVLFGGAGTVWGPLVGGAILSVIGEVLWAQFQELHLALFGALVILTMLFLPQGVVPVIKRWLVSRPTKKGPPVAGQAREVGTSATRTNEEVG